MGIPEAIFKAYDIRGLYPAEFAEDAAERVGYALAQQLGAARVGVGRDPRPSSPSIADAFAAGAAAAGAAVVDFGMVATEMLYYGVADRRLDGGAMVTASHNPPTYNGMKLVGDGALPLSGEQGMPELMQRTLAVGELPQAAADGRTAEDLYPDYVKHLHGFVDVAGLPAAKVVMDAANGVAGKLAPLVFDGAPLDRIDLYFEVDGSFPNHEPNPLLEENRASSWNACWPRRPTSVSPGTATPTAASSSTRTASSCPATSSRRCSPRRCSPGIPAPPSSTTSAPAGRCRTRSRRTAACPC